MRRTYGRNFDYPVPLEGRMVRQQLARIAMDASKLHNALQDDDDLPAWVLLKINTAEDRLHMAADYMRYKVKPGLEAYYAGADASTMAAMIASLPAPAEETGKMSRKTLNILLGSATGFTMGGLGMLRKDATQEVATAQVLLGGLFGGLIGGLLTPAQSTYGAEDAAPKSSYTRDLLVFMGGAVALVAAADMYQRWKGAR
jgi:hypothetical protein